MGVDWSEIVRLFDMLNKMHKLRLYGRGVYEGPFFIEWLNSKCNGWHPTVCDSVYLVTAPSCDKNTFRISGRWEGVVNGSGNKLHCSFFHYFNT